MRHRHKIQPVLRGGPPTLHRPTLDGAAGSAKPGPPVDAVARALPLVSFDWRTIVATPATGTVGYPLLSDADTWKIPDGYRGIVDQIIPYLEGGAGRVVGPRLDPSVTMRWRLYIAGRPAQPYAAITDLLTDWAPTSAHALLEIPGRRQITCLLDVVDPGGLYPIVGLRVCGRIELLP